MNEYEIDPSDDEMYPSELYPSEDEIYPSEYEMYSKENEIQCICLVTMTENGSFCQF